jgi:[ribosomal protein S5]-alanine N-acetyltransferase
MDIINFTPFPGLTTERLNLRQMKIQDENEIFALRSDERVQEFLDRPKAKIIDDARKFIEKINDGIAKNEWIYWGITLKNESKLIGTICFWNISKEHFRAEIGYELHPDFQGKGIMQEAIIKVIDYGFEKIKFNSIVANLDPNNSKSIKLLERNGFICDRKLKGTVIYSLKKHKYAK